VTVKLRGGDVIVHYSDAGVTLTGDANLIFEGQLEY